MNALEGIEGRFSAASLLSDVWYIHINCGGKNLLVH